MSFCKNIAKIKSSGFTLIELLVVIAILGILDAVGVPIYQGYISNAGRDTREIQGQLDALGELDTIGVSVFDEGDKADNPDMTPCRDGHHPCTTYSSDSCQNPLKGGHSPAVAEYFTKLRCDTKPASIYCKSPQ